MSKGSSKRKRKNLKRNDDAISEAIAHVAIAKQQPKAKHTSRFFFELDDPAIEIEPEVKPVNEELVTLTNDLKKELPKELQAISSKVRDFFLSELAPTMLASFMGVEQSREVLTGVLGLEVDASTENKFKAFMVKAADVKMARYVQSLMSLSDEDARILIDSLKPRPPGNIVMPLGSGYESKVKHKKEKAQGEDSRRRSTGRQSEIDLP